MSSGKKYAPVVALFLALVLAGTAMILRYWLVASQSDSGLSMTLNIGIKTMSVHATKNGQTVMDWSGTFDEAESKGLLTQESADLFNKAGNYILGFGVVAIIALAASFVLSLIALGGSCSANNGAIKTVSCVLTLVAAILMAIGFVLWAQKFDVGYSFTLSIVAAFLFLAGAFSLGSALVGRVPSKTQQHVGILLLVVGVAILIASMVTVSWYHIEGESNTVTYTRQYGLKRWKWTAKTQAGVESSWSGALADGPGSAMSDGPQKTLETERMAELDKVGTNVIVTGTLAGVLAAIGFVLHLISKPAAWSVLVSVFAGGLTMVGVFLYADKLFIGASYIIFVASTFLTIVAFVLLIASYTSSGTDSNASTSGYVAHNGTPRSSNMGLPDQIVPDTDYA